MSKPNNHILAVYDGLTVEQKAVTDCLLNMAVAKGFAKGMIVAGAVVLAAWVTDWAVNANEERKRSKLFRKGTREK